MLCNGYDKVLELSHGDLVELNDARGSTVRVTKGMIWLTQEDDTQDIVLRPGDVWTVERGGLTLLQAQGDTFVCVLGAQTDIARPLQRRVRLAGRVRDWLASAWSRKAGSVPYY